MLPMESLCILMTLVIRPRIAFIYTMAEQATKIQSLTFT
jgi:hypothetical protein